MQLLIPRHEVVADVDALIRSEHRPAPVDRPWVVVNMITSLDGAIEIDGRSGGLATAGDKAVFRSLRGVADTILVAAGTARAENYGPPKLDQGASRRRVAAGQASVPRLAVVTRTCALDPDSRLFENGYKPLVITTIDAVADADLVARARWLRAGSGTVDLAATLRQLREEGDEIVLVEGGPTLNAHLLRAGLVDEWCVTIAPLLAGADTPGLAGTGDHSSELRCDRLMTDGTALFTRYLTERISG